MTPPPRRVMGLLFVYGTLQRGCTNHAQLAGQAWVGAARTPPGFRLYQLEGYPGLVAHPDDRTGVSGEVWSVDAAGLERLDRFEGVAEGLYRRAPLPLLSPFAGQVVETYWYARSVAGRADLGGRWT